MSMRVDYKSENPNAGVQNYELVKGGIILEFADRDFRYVYNAEKPGAHHVAEMIRLARSGRGLTTYVNKHIRDNYAAKFRRSGR